MLIIRKPTLHYTASGIITPIGLFHEINLLQNKNFVHQVGLITEINTKRVCSVGGITGYVFLVIKPRAEDVCWETGSEKCQRSVLFNDVFSY